MTDIQKRIAGLTPEQLEQFKKKLAANGFKLNENNEVVKILNTDTEESSINKTEDAEHYELSHGQKRIWILEQLETNTAYNMPEAYWLEGELHTDSFQKAFDFVMNRHESLRTVFITHNDVPRQKVLKSVESTIGIYHGSEEEALKIAKEEFMAPFDLENGPLVRFTLVKTENRTLLLFNMHHIISDGWSMNIFVGELMSSYLSFSKGKTPVLSPLNIQYRDYALWQNKALKGSDFDGEKAYWMNKLAGEIPALSLPAENPRPSVQSFKGASREFTLSKELSLQLTELCKNHELSLFMILQALLKTLFYRYTGQEDILLGSPVAGRSHEDLENQIGFYVNTLVFRDCITGSQSFQEIMQRVKNTCTEAFNNQDYPFDLIVEDLGIKRDLSRSPLFDIMLVLQNNTTADVSGQDFALSPCEQEHSQSKFDMTFNFTETEEGLYCALEYNTDIYSEKTAVRLWNHFTQILSSAIKNPASQIKDLSLTTSEERELLKSFSKTRCSAPLNKSIKALFEECAEIYSDKTALVYKDESLSYRELNEKANALAHCLREEINITPGDPVALAMEKSTEMITALLAIVKAGGVYVPLDTEYPKERLSFILEDVNPKAVLTDRERGFKDSIVITDLTERSEKNPSVTVNSSSPAYIIYTSGSTGKPKGALIPHRGVVRLVKNPDYITLSSEDRIYQTGSLSFDASTFEIWGALLNGAELHLSDNILNTEDAAREIKEKGITTLWLTARLFDQISTSAPELFAPLKTLLAGGDRLSVPHINTIRTLYPHLTIMNGYGPTENTTFTCCYEITETSEKDFPIGKPIAGTEIVILDRDGNVLPPGIPGELCILGEGLAQGYLNRKELTEEKFRLHKETGERMYMSGDIAAWREDGNIDFFGRRDNQVKIRGFRIETGEIEHALEQHREITGALVMVMENMGEKLLAVWYESEKEQEGLREFLSNALPDYMLPSFFTWVKEFPLNTNGKVDKKSLPPVHQNIKSSEAPLNDTEKALAQIWKETLNLNELPGRHDNFFELGGHSLKATMIVSRVNREMEKALGLKDIFQNPTIALLSDVPAEKKEKTLHTINKAPEREHYALSHSQKRLWVLDQIEGNTTAYNMPSAFVFKGELDRNSFEKAWKEITQRHESLRTVFLSVEGEPRQKILPSLTCALTERKVSEEEAMILAQKEISTPFSLEKGPLLRFLLLKTPERNLLLFNMHHIITDGWSMTLFVKEFFTLYNSFKNGKVAELSPVKLQYRDFSEWQNSALKEELNSQRAYWTDKLRGLKVLDLPADSVRPPVKSYRGESFDFSLPQTLAEGLNRLSREKGVSLFASLTALIKTLFYRYTGEEDITVGTPAAGRSHSDLEDQIGFYVNTLALRDIIEGEQSFTEVLKNISTTCQEALENQDYPFDRLLEDINPPADLSRSPLFDVMVILQNNERAEMTLSGGELSPLAMESGISKFDITLEFVPYDEGISCRLEYNTDIYTRERMEELRDHLITLTRSVLQNPAESINSLNLLTEKNKEALKKWNQTEKEFEPATLSALFEKQAEERPDAPALTTAFSPLKAPITYRELNEKANLLARGLKESHGLGKGDLAAVVLDRSQWLIISILAILKTGAAWVPVDPDYPVERVRLMTEGCKVVLAEDSSVEGTLSPQKVKGSSAENLPGEISPCDRAYVIYTSGSTGTPKGTEISHKSVVNFLSSFNHQFNEGFSEKDNCLSLVSACFDVSVCEFFMPLISGAHLHLFDHKNIDLSELTEYLCEKQITFAYIHPGLLRDTAELMAGKKCSLNKLLAGVEGIPDTTFNLFLDLNENMEIINGYGPTEATVCASFFKYKVSETGKNVPIGTPLHNTRIYITDSRGNLLPPGIPGELCIGGTGLAMGYLNNRELTNEKFINNPFEPGEKLYLTGDLAMINKGNLEFLGRRDNQVKVRGYRMEMGEIESTLLRHENITHAVVLPEKSESGDSLIAWYCSKQPLKEEEIRVFLSDYLPGYMVPSVYISMKSIPLTANGKTDIKALPRQEKAQKVYVSPVSDREKALARIWKEVLSCEKEVSLTDNFFDLGGHSLRATRLVTRVTKEMGFSLTLKNVFENPVLRDMSRILVSSESHAINKAEEKEKYVLSHGQKRLWVLDRLEEGSLAYNMPSAYTLKGAINAENFQKAFELLIMRHESLRTVFVKEGEEVFQKILSDPQYKIALCAGDKKSVKKAAEKDLASPFDLEQGPLMRITLCQGDDESVVLINTHHIISDGWSQGIFIKEFLQAYTALNEGKQPEFSPLNLQYKDYAEWQRSELEGDGIGAHREYWHMKLQGELPVLSLPADYPRPKEKSYAGKTLHTLLSPEVLEAFQDLCRINNASLFMGLNALVKTFLYKYTGQEDIITGSPVAGRTHEDLAGQIGLFINTLALRDRVKSSVSFTEFLNSVKETCHGALAHQDYPFDLLVEELEPKRDLSRSPLFDVMVILQNNEEPGAQGFAAAPYEREHCISKFDLTFGFKEAPEGLVLSLEFSTDLFKEKRMGAMISHMKNLLGDILMSPEKPLADLSLLGAEEKKALLALNNSTELPFNKEATLVSLFKEQARLTPEAPALTCEKESLSYRELNELSERVASALLKRFSLESDDIVGLFMERSSMAIVSLLGILKAGAAYLPLDPSTPGERVQEILRDAGAKGVITDCDLPGGVPYSELMTEEAGKVSVPIRPDSLAYVIYTSGSTGKPKGVMVEHRSVVNLTEALKKRIYSRHTEESGTGLNVSLFASLAFDASVQQIFTALTQGHCLHIIPGETKTDIQALADFYRKKEIHIADGTPVIFELLPAAFHSSEGFHMKEFIIGGDALASEAVSSMYSLFPESSLSITNIYGPTECCVDASAYHCTGKEEPGQILPIGTPLANTKMYILDRDLNPVPRGVPGELWITGIGVARGYLNRPKLTEERFILCPFEKGERMYKTGDLASLREDGNIAFHGRTDNQVKIRGYRIEPGEIENTLLQMEGIRQAVVRVRKGNLVAWYVSDRELPSLKEELKKTLPSYMVPAWFIPMEELPLNASGKTDVKALPDPETGNREYCEPVTETEKALSEIWKEVLGTERAGLSDNFFESGGNSLKAITLVSRMSPVLGREISLKTLFTHPTIEELLRDSGEESSLSLPEIVLNPNELHEPFPLTDVQQAYWLGRNDHYELGGVGTHGYSEFYTETADRDKIEECMNLLILRHPMLRMVLTKEGQQTILENPGSWELKFMDLQGLSEEEEKEKFMAVREELSHQVFDPYTWPLFDIRLTRLGHGGYKVHYSVDALLMDGASNSLLFKEFAALYSGESLPPLELSFRDYVLAENSLKESEFYSRSREYWMNRLPELPGRAELPLAVSPSEIGAPRFERRELLVDEKIWKSAKKRIQELQVTPTVFFIQCFSQTIEKWSKNSRFLLNLTLFNRIPFHRDVDHIIGDFTSLTLLEMDCSRKKSFEERLKATQSRLWEDLEHKYFTGVEVQRELSSLHGETITIPLVVTSMLGFDSGSSENTEELKEELCQEYSITQTPQVWIDFQLREEGDTVFLNWDFVSGLFPEGMIDHMFQGFQELLESFARGDRAEIALPTAERISRDEANKTEAAHSDKRLCELFLEAAETRGDKRALISRERTLSYRELADLSLSLGEELKNSGAVPGELVALIMHKGWQQPAGALAIQFAGAAYMPVDASLPEERIQKLLELGEVKRIVTTEALKKEFTLEQEVFTVDSVTERKGLEKNFTYSQKITDLAYVIFTSGSTGEPKGVMIDHRGAVNTLLDINERFDINEKDTCFALSSMSFDLSVYDVFGLLSAGGSVVIPSPSEQKDPGAWLKWLKEEEVTVWNSVPALMSMLTEYAEDQRASVKTVLLSGDWIPVSLADKIKKMNPGAEVISLGGATEASVWSIFYPIHEVDPAWKSIPYGKPLKNQSFYIFKASEESPSAFSECPVYVPGDLYIGGTGVAQGYWKDEVKTACSFINHPVTNEKIYRTGDLGRYLPDGNIEFLGREDAQVKVQGYRIELGEIEETLKSHPLIENAVADARSLTGTGRELIAWIMPKTADTVGDLADSGNSIIDKNERAAFKMEMRGMRSLTGETHTLTEGNKALLLKKEPQSLSEGTLSLDEFSALFHPFSCYPVDGLTLPKYYYPSAGSLYPVQVSVSVPANRVEGISEGCYYFHPLKKQLVKTSSKALKKEDITLFFTGDLGAIEPLYGRYSREFCELEAGYMAQLLKETAPFIPHSTEESKLLREALQLSDKHILLCSFTPGVMKKESLREPLEIAGEGTPFKPVDLPEVQTLTLSERKSYRTFLKECVTQVQLSTMLSTLNSLDTDSFEGLTLWLAVKSRRVEGLKGGLYVIDRARNQLVFKKNEEILFDLFRGSETIWQDGAFALFITGKKEKGNLITAGAAGQALMKSTRDSIGLCAIGIVGQNEAEKLFNPVNDTVLHSFIGGSVSHEAIESYTEVKGSSDPFQLIRKYLEEQLPEYMVPKHFVHTDSVPLTSNGKVNRKALPDPHKKQEGVYRAPENELQKTMAEIWQEVLELERVSIDKNFFELGGNSLSAITLINKLDKQAGISLSLTTLFENPTIEALSQSSAGEQTEEISLPELITEEEKLYEPFPMTDVQQAYWIGRSDHYDLGGVGTHSYSEIFFEELDPERLEWAINYLIQRHEMLRMVVTPEGEQRILEDVSYKLNISDLSGKTPEEERAFMLAKREELSHQLFTGETWPLFDYQIIRFADGTWKYLSSMDSLVMDVASGIIYLRELMQVYSGEEKSLPQLSLNFRDYVVTEHYLRTTELYTKAKEYWTKRVPSLPAAPDLPLAKSPSEVEETHFTKQRMILPEEIWTTLKEKAQNAGVTPTVFLTHCFGEVLRKWSKSDHFTLNMTLFNRLPFHEDVNSIIGDFTSLTLLEMDFREDKSFTEQLKQIQSQLWQDLEHKYFSGVEVQREMSAAAGQTVTIPVVITSTLGVAGEETPAETVTAAANLPDYKEDYSISQTPQVWIDCQIAEINGGLKMDWDSVEELFPEDMLQDMFQALEKLFYHMASGGADWEKKAPELTPQCHLMLKEEANKTAAHVSEKLMFTNFINQVKNRGDKTALISKNRRVSYRELYNISDVLSEKLKAYGARPNTLIAVVMHKGWEQAAAVLGIQMSGAAYMPVDASFPEERINQLIALGEADIVVTLSDVLQEVTLKEGVKTVTLDTLEITEREIKAPSLQKNTDLAYVIFTSGSTGEPKGVMIDHRGAVNTIEDINSRFQMTEEDCCFALSSLSFDLSVYDIFGLLSSGGRIVFPAPQERKDPSAWMPLLLNEKITVWNSVPALFQMLTEYLGEETQEKLFLKEVLLSGDWIPLTLPEKIRALSPGVRVTSLGGATEASIWSIFYPINEIAAHWKSIPYGKPLQNQSFHVLKKDLTPCPLYVPGDLFIGGTGLALGYWKDEEKTASSFITHPATGERLYRTGDLGRYLPDGNIEFMGREDSQVKVQGYRIELGEIEAALMKHPLIKSAAADARVLKGTSAHQIIAYVLPEEKKSDSVGDLAHSGNTIVDSHERSAFKMERHGVRQLTGHKISLKRTFEELTITPGTSFELTEEVLSLEELSAMLTPLSSKKYEEVLLPRYYYPSAGSLYPVQVYITTGEGALSGVDAGHYYYHPDEHALVYTGEYSGEGISLTLAGDLDAITPLYGKYGEEFSVQEAGYMAWLLMSSLPENTAVKEREISSCEGYLLSKSHLPLKTYSLGRGYRHVNSSHFPFVSEEGTSLPCTDTILTAQTLSMTERKSYRSFCRRQVPFSSISAMTERLKGLEAFAQEQNCRVFAAVKENRVDGLSGGIYALSGEGFIKVKEMSPLYALFAGSESILESAAFALFITGEDNRENHFLSGAAGQALMMGIKEEIGLCAIGIVNQNEAASLLSLKEERVLHSFLGGSVSKDQIHNVLAPEETQPGEILKTWLEERLPDYMVPSHFVTVDSVPLTANGKVNRKALPDPEVQSRIHEYTPPGNLIEKKVCEIWQDVLGQEKVGIYDNFFEIGGNSLSAIQIITRMNQLNLEISIHDIYREMTIKGILGSRGDMLMEETNTERQYNLNFKPSYNIYSYYYGCPNEILNESIRYQGLKDFAGSILPMISGTPYTYYTSFFHCISTFNEIQYVNTFLGLKEDRLGVERENHVFPDYESYRAKIVDELKNNRVVSADVSTYYLNYSFGYQNQNGDLIELSERFSPLHSIMVVDIMKNGDFLIYDTSFAYFGVVSEESFRMAVGGLGSIPEFKGHYLVDQVTPYTMTTIKVKPEFLSSWDRKTTGTEVLKEFLTHYRGEKALQVSHSGQSVEIHTGLGLFDPLLQDLRDERIHSLSEEEFKDKVYNFAYWHKRSLETVRDLIIEMEEYYPLFNETLKIMNKCTDRLEALKEESHTADSLYAVVETLNEEFHMFTEHMIRVLKE